MLEYGQGAQNPWLAVLANEKQHRGEKVHPELPSLLFCCVHSMCSFSILIEAADAWRISLRSVWRNKCYSLSRHRKHVLESSIWKAAYIWRNCTLQFVLPLGWMSAWTLELMKLLEMHCRCHPFKFHSVLKLLFWRCPCITEDVNVRVGKSLWSYACEVISSAQLSWRVDWLPEFRRFRPAMGAELWLSMNKRVLDADRPLLILLRPIGHLVSCYVWVASAAPISRGERLRDGSWDASKPPSWIWIPKLEFCRQILVVREAWVQHCLAFLPALVHPLFALTVGRSFAMSWC